MNKKFTLIAALFLAGFMTSCSDSDDSSPECTKDAKKCEGASVMTCSAEGKWTVSQACKGDTPVCSTSTFKCEAAKTTACTAANAATVCKRDNATATCPAGTCVFTCNTGYEEKNGKCEPKSSAEPACTAANVSDKCKRDNATATCPAGTCVFACNTGYEEKNGKCEPKSSEPECTAANVSDKCKRDNATATCPAGTCVFACNTGYEEKNNVCVPTEDTEVDCTPETAAEVCINIPEHSIAKCTDGFCDYECEADYIYDGGNCVEPQCTEENAATACMRDNANAFCDHGFCIYTCKEGFVPRGDECVEEGSGEDIDTPTGDFAPIKLALTKEPADGDCTADFQATDPNITTCNYIKADKKLSLTYKSGAKIDIATSNISSSGYNLKKDLDTVITNINGASTVTIQYTIATAIKNLLKITDDKGGESILTTEAKVEEATEFIHTMNAGASSATISKGDTKNNVFTIKELTIN